MKLGKSYILCIEQKKLLKKHITNEFNKFNKGITQK